MSEYDARDDFSEEELAEIRRRYKESQEQPLKLSDLRKLSGFNLFEMGSIGQETASRCPKCGGMRIHSWQKTYSVEPNPFDSDVIYCRQCHYTEHKQEDGTYAPSEPFDESKLHDRVSWWAD